MCLQKDSKTEYSELLSESTQTTEHYLLLYDQHYTPMIQITALNMFVSQETGKNKTKKKQARSYQAETDYKDPRVITTAYTSAVIYLTLLSMIGWYERPSAEVKNCSDHATRSLSWKTAH